MPNMIYLDCFSGISGDMALAALADAGADRRYIAEELSKLPTEPFELQWRTVVKQGISALKLEIALPKTEDAPQHRHYSDIVQLIEAAGFNKRVAGHSLDMFAAIARAEARIHQIPIEHVHFHEVGALDSLIDIIGIALALDSLNADLLIMSPPPLGFGQVRCDHGLYPVPAPATLELLLHSPVARSDTPAELTTPTGAAVAAVMADGFLAGLPSMTPERIGYGAGTRDLPGRPNVLRAVVGRISPADVPPLRRRPPEAAAAPDSGNARHGHGHERHGQEHQTHEPLHGHGHEHHEMGHQALEPEPLLGHGHEHHGMEHQALEPLHRHGHP